MLGIRRNWIYNFSRSLSAIANAALSTILIGEDVMIQERSQQAPVSCLQQSYHCYWDKEAVLYLEVHVRHPCGSEQG